MLECLSDAVSTSISHFTQLAHVNVPDLCQCVRYIRTWCGDDFEYIAGNEMETLL